MMGVRADITPQVARIDAHNLNRQGPVRLCYADNVMHTRPRGLLTSRVPIRIGAELFGHGGVACDIELIELMARTVQAAGIGPIHIVLGHVGIFRSLVAASGLDDDAEHELFDIMQRKAFGELDVWLAERIGDESLRLMLKELARLSGGVDILPRANEVLASAPAAVHNALRDLSQITEAISRRQPTVTLGFDLCELRGYQYHTGLVFAAYTPGYGRSVAKGGRFDDIGRVFGRARPASGFDADLKLLARLSTRADEPRRVVLAPHSDDPGLHALVEQLRGAGEIVVVHLEAQDASESLLAELNCTRRIVSDPAGQGWQVIDLSIGKN